MKAGIDQHTYLVEGGAGVGGYIYVVWQLLESSFPDDVSYPASSSLSKISHALQMLEDAKAQVASAAEDNFDLGHCYKIMQWTS